MLEATFVFLSGIFIFLFTGLDDLMVVYTLIHEQTKKQRILVCLGTLLGTLIMFCLVCIFNYLLKNCLLQNIDSIRQYLWILLFIPAIYALRIIYRNFKPAEDKKTDNPSNSGSKFFWLAWVIYLSNMADDVTINLTFMLNIEHRLDYIFLLLGNLAGCLIMFLLADQLMKKLSASRHKKAIIISVATCILLLCMGKILF